MSTPVIPIGYRLLPEGFACRCINFKRDEDGRGWCCRPMFETGAGPSKPFAMSKADSDLEVSYPYFRLAKKLALPYGDVVRAAEGFAAGEGHPRPSAARTEAIAAAERLPPFVLRLLAERVSREQERRRATAP